MLRRSYLFVEFYNKKQLLRRCNPKAGQGVIYLLGVAPTEQNIFCLLIYYKEVSPTGNFCFWLLPNQLNYLQILYLIAIHIKAHKGTHFLPALLASRAGVKMQATDLFIIDHF